MSLYIIGALLFIAFTNPVQAQKGDFVLLWSYDTGKDVSSVSQSADGSYIVAGFEREVILLNRNREILWNFQTAFPVTDVSISADASFIVVGTSQGTGIADGRLYILNKNGGLLGDMETNGISSVSVSPDGGYWAMTYKHGLGWWDKVILYSRAGGNWLWVYTVGQSETGSVSVSAHGDYLAVSSGAVGGKACEIRFYNKQGELLWRYEIAGRFVGRAHSISLSADARYIVAGDEHGDEVLLLNHEGRVLWNYRTGIIEGVSISGDGNYVVAGSRDAIYLLNRNGQLLWNYSANDLEDVSLSHDGSYIAIGSGSKVNLFVESIIAANFAINVARRSISVETGQGFIITEAEALFSQAEQALITGDYLTARSLAEQAQVRAEEIGRKGRLAESAIIEARNAIAQVVIRDFNANEARTLMLQAKHAFEFGDYSSAMSYAEQAEVSAEEMIKVGELAEAAINEARDAISQEMAKGFVLTEAISLMVKAEQAFAIGDFRSAYEIAGSTQALAIDLDQDNVLNYLDFSPNFNNMHIYIGSLALVVLTIISLFYEHKRECRGKAFQKSGKSRI